MDPTDYYLKQTYNKLPKKKKTTSSINTFEPVVYDKNIVQDISLCPSLTGSFWNQGILFEQTEIPVYPKKDPCHTSSNMKHWFMIRSFLSFLLFSEILRCGVRVICQSIDDRITRKLPGSLCVIWPKTCNEVNVINIRTLILLT